MSGTAIAVVYSSEGFAIAADGREMRDAEVNTDDRQKIFAIEPEETLAYALAGSAIITHTTATTQYNLEADVARAVQQAISGDALTFGGYLDNVRSVVYEGLRAAKESGTVDTYPNLDGQGTIATLIIAGYYKGQAVDAAVQITHKDQCLRLPFPIP